VIGQGLMHEKVFPLPAPELIDSGGSVVAASANVAAAAATTTATSAEGL